MASIEIISEVTGTVWKVETEAGKSLEEDDAIMIIESMKMEIPVEAPEGGTITEILVGEGDAVAEGQLLATMEI